MYIVYLVISLPKIVSVHCINMVLINPRYAARVIVSLISALKRARILCDSSTRLAKAEKEVAV